MQAWLEHDELWDCVLGEAASIANAAKVTKAKSKIILSIEPINYVHIQDCATAKEVWEKLQITFEDSGLTRKVGLLRALTSTQLDKCKNIEEYVNTIITAAHKLNGIGFKVPDDWVGTLLLAGLPDEYRPMIMGLENSGTAITADSIKTKLFQEVKSPRSVKNTSSEAAFYTKDTKAKSLKVKCFRCKGIGHYATKCKTKLDEQASSSNQGAKKTTPNEKKAYWAFLTKGTEETSNKDWYVDSCASQHMTMNNEGMQNQRKCTAERITVANSQGMSARSIGDIDLRVQTHEGAQAITVRDALHVPETSVNLLSVAQMVQKGLSVHFTPEISQICDEEGRNLGTMSLEGGIYKLDTVMERTFYAKAKPTAELWHRRLGHLNYQKIAKLSKDPATGINLSRFEEKSCVPCIKGKITKKPFPKDGKRASEILEVIHSDLCGPMETTSLGGSKYFMTLIDDFSRKVFVYFLEGKDQAKDTIQEFKALVETQTGKRIKSIRTDNGREFVNRGLQRYLRESGIRHQLTVPYSPEQNGLAERMNRTIVERAKSMLFDADLPKEYWAEAVATAVYLINRSPATGNNEKIPEKEWSGHKPHLGHLKVFGCRAMAQIPKERRQKWDSKAEEFIFTGYDDNTKGYRLIDPETYRVVKRRNVVFLEEQRLTKTNKIDQPKEFIDISIVEEDAEVEENAQVTDAPESDDYGTAEVSDTDSESTVREESDSEYLTGYSDDASASDGSPPIDDAEEANGGAAEPQPARRSSRTPKPVRMTDYVTYLAVGTDTDDPQTVREALSGQERDLWKRAMEEERKSLIKNDTWTLADLPAGRKALETKWVFRTKKDSAGRVERHKARLVVKGCSQKEGIDYQETYSPVIRYASVRFLCALASKYALRMDQMDVATAYLHGELEEEIYVTPPKELAEPNQGKKVWRLKKSMYGLKQSGRAWNKKLDGTLKEIGLRQSKADACIYYKKTKDSILIVGIYVDDMLILADGDNTMSKVKAELSARFQMTDLGEARHLLGIRITRDEAEGEVRIDQEAYIRKMLEKFKMMDCKPVSTPNDPNQKLTKEDLPMGDDEANEMSKVPYKEAIGSLLYASQATRPDIAYAVGLVSRFCQQPRRIHWVAVKRILRYLRGTLSAKLVFSKKGDPNVEGYSDADWANEADDRRSITGNIFKFQSGPISWQSKKQRTVALSTTEAEYMALSATSQEALWIRSLALELDPEAVSRGLKIFCDNKGAIDLAKNAGYRPRTKHIDVRHHFVREGIERGNIVVEFIPTENMIADALTKGLFGPKLKACTKQMGLKT